MKKLLLLLVLALAAIGAVNTASAHGFRGGIYIGGPVWGPSYYYPPPYYYGPPVYVQPAAPAPPPVYVEQKTDDYWYYCAQPKAYYPYVKECPQGWMRVVPGSGPGPR